MNDTDQQFLHKVYQLEGPPARWHFPDQPWEQWDIGELANGEVVCLREEVDRWTTLAWFDYMSPDALGMGTANVLALDKVKRLTAVQVCAHPLFRDVLETKYGPEFGADPVATVQYWQETWS